MAVHRMSPPPPAPPLPDQSDHRGRRQKFTIGKIWSGHSWYTYFWVLDPPSPPPFYFSGDTPPPFSVPVSSVPPAFNCPPTALQPFWNCQHLPDTRFANRPQPIVSVVL